MPEMHSPSPLSARTSVPAEHLVKPGSSGGGLCFLFFALDYSRPCELALSGILFRCGFATCSSTVFGAGGSGAATTCACAVDPATILVGKNEPTRLWTAPAVCCVACKQPTRGSNDSRLDVVPLDKAVKRGKKSPPFSLTRKQSSPLGSCASIPLVFFILFITMVKCSTS
jgi:hypothetical protein